MVVTAQMQRTVHHEMRHMMLDPPPLCAGFPPHDAERKRNVAALECQHVGGFIAAAMLRIEALHGLVGRQQDRARSARNLGGTPGNPLDARHESTPAPIIDDDVRGQGKRSLWPRRVGGAAFTAWVHRIRELRPV